MHRPRQPTRHKLAGLTATLMAWVLLPTLAAQDPEAAPAPEPAGDIAQPAPATPPAATEPADARTTAVRSVDVPTPPTPSLEAELHRVRAQLEAMLSESGLPREADRQQAAERIDALARESARLARDLPDPKQKLLASQYELQAYNALAQEAQQEARPAEATFRNMQMRNTALNVRTLEAPAAATVGDFWVTQADLFEVNRHEPDADRRQLAAIERLGAFVAEHEQIQDETARAIVLETQLALLRLYDERGMSRQACALLVQVRERAADQPQLLAELAQWYGYCSALGQRFDAVLPLLEGGTWSAAEHRGKPLLIHFFAAGWPQTLPSFEQVLAAREAVGRDRLAVVSVKLAGALPSSLDASIEPAVPADAFGDDMAGDGVAAAPRSETPEPLIVPQAVDWPLCGDPSDTNGLQTLLAIHSLPRYVLLDEAGRVAAVGGGLAILGEMNKIPNGLMNKSSPDPPLGDGERQGPAPEPDTRRSESPDAQP